MQQNKHLFLDAKDPLFTFLAHDVYRQVLEINVDQPVFEVYPADKKGIIFRYVEQKTGIDVACKFYGNRRTSSEGDMNDQAVADLMQREFDSLQRVWGLGLKSAALSRRSPAGSEREHQLCTDRGICHWNGP